MLVAESTDALDEATQVEMASLLLAAGADINQHVRDSSGGPYWKVTVSHRMALRRLLSDHGGHL